MHLDALNPTLIFPHYHAVPGNGHLAAPAARVSLDGEEAQEIGASKATFPYSAWERECLRAQRFT